MGASALSLEMDSEKTSTPKDKDKRTDIISIYALDVHRHSVPSKEEEIVFFAKIVESCEKLIKSFVPRINEERWVELESILNVKDAPFPVEKGDFDEFKKSLGKNSSVNLMKMIRLTEAGKIWQESCIHDIDQKEDVDRRVKKKIREFVRETRKLKAEFVYKNLRLVLSITRKYVRSAVWHTHSDLIQEGNMGLIKAVDRFDPDRGLRFSTYAVWWIRQNITRSLDEIEKSIRTPINQMETQRKMRSMEIKFFALHGRSPSIEEYSEAINDGKKRIGRTLEGKINSILRIDLPTSEGTSLHDIIVDDDAIPLDDSIMKTELPKRIDRLLTRLTPQESTIIRWRFGISQLSRAQGVEGSDPMTLEEVGKIVGVTRERIRQIEAAAIRKLKEIAKDLDVKNQS
jgi:RNA polymerase sigma factor (sigma-70 family)